VNISFHDKYFYAEVANNKMLKIYLQKLSELTVPGTHLYTY